MNGKETTAASDVDTWRRTWTTRTLRVRRPTGSRATTVQTALSCRLEPTAGDAGTVSNMDGKNMMARATLGEAIGNGVVTMFLFIILVGHIFIEERMSIAMTFKSR